MLSLAVDVSLPSIAYAALEDDGIARTTDGGVHWPLRRLPSFKILALGMAGRFVFAAGYYRIYRSADLGRTWRRVWSARARGIAALATAPWAPNLVYAGEGEGSIYRSTNDGTTWRHVGTLHSGTLRFVAIAGRSPKLLVAGTTAALLTSNDGGHTWRTATGASGQLETIVRDPRRPRVLYLATSSVRPMPGGGVYRSTDTGRHWRLVGSGLPTSVLSVAVNPRRRRTLYAGTCDYGGRGGVYRLTGSTGRWTKTSRSEPTCVSALALTPSGRRLLVGTHDQGVFSVRLR